MTSLYDIALKVQTQIDNNKARSDFRLNNKDTGCFSNRPDASVSIVIPSVIVTLGTLAVAYLMMM